MIKNKIERHLIILTCTVFPQVEQNLVRSNPLDRLNDYLKSIPKVISDTKDLDASIVIVENSGSIELIRDGLSKRGIDTSRIIFCPCKIDKLSSNSGISAGEHEMLKFVSSFLDFSNYDVVWKLTGRLNIDNLTKIILLSDGDLRVNRFFTPNHIIDSRFFGARQEVFKDFALNVPDYSEYLTSDHKWKYFNSFRAIEFYLVFFGLKIESMGMSVKSLPAIPVYRGISASTGKALDSFSTRLKVMSSNRIRHLLVKGLLGSSP